jgi:anti-anti-sigma regulatory factor
VVEKMASHKFTISEVSVEGPRATLAISGELDEHVDRGTLRTSLVEHLGDDGVREIILDISDLTALALESVAALTFLGRDMAAHGKVLRIVGATGQPEQKLRTTGMLNYFADPPKPDRSADG